MEEMEWRAGCGRGKVELFTGIITWQPSPLKTTCLNDNTCCWQRAKNGSGYAGFWPGAVYTLHLQPDPQLERYLDGLIAKIAAAQEADGYLYTARTINPSRLYVLRHG
jgi:hypothetical protein